MLLRRLALAKSQINALASLTEIYSTLIGWERENRSSLPGGLEPPTFRLTAERANRLRHRDEFFTQRVACSKETRIIFIVFIRDLVFYCTNLFLSRS